MSRIWENPPGQTDEFLCAMAMEIFPEGTIIGESYPQGDRNEVWIRRDTHVGDKRSTVYLRHDAPNGRLDVQRIQMHIDNMRTLARDENKATFLMADPELYDKVRSFCR